MGEAHGIPERRADRAPLVGRSTELDLLDRALKQSGKGGPAVVDITGEAGIGKSRLLTEFAAQARRGGVTVLRGRATECEWRSPFQPFADAFTDLDPQALHGFAVSVHLAPILRGAEGWPTTRRAAGTGSASTGRWRRCCAISVAGGSW